MAKLLDGSGDAGSNLVTGTGTATATFPLPGNVPLSVESVYVEVDNTAGAATTGLLTIRDSSGQVIARKRQGATIDAGASGSATWAFRLDDNEGSSSNTGLPVLDFAAFTPAGNKVQITSIDPDVPTAIASAGAVTFDGVTQIRLEFFASAIDLDQRGKTAQASVNLELYRDSTALGVVFVFNIGAGLYGALPCYLVAFDTPPAGTATYSVKGYREAAAGTIGNAFVYGTGVVTPHATRAGFLDILKA